MILFHVSRLFDKFIQNKRRIPDKAYKVLSKQQKCVGNVENCERLKITITSLAANVNVWQNSLQKNSSLETTTHISFLQETHGKQTFFAWPCCCIYFAFWFTRCAIRQWFSNIFQKYALRSIWNCEPGPQTPDQYIYIYIYTYCIIESLQTKRRTKHAIWEAQ